MRLFHVSEEENISIFIPRIPTRKDLCQDIGLVWAILEEKLPNFITPRDCPRIGYSINEYTKEEDINNYIDSSNIKHVLVIEQKWFKQIQETTLYLYEFSTDNFELQDANAGYYISKKAEIPIAKYIIKDCFNELFKRNVEVKIVDNLFDYSEKIKKTTFSWSLCRMRNASKP